MPRFAEAILTAESIYVSYRLANRRINGFKEYIITRFVKNQKIEVQEFKALKNVSIALKGGECLGIIGHNGSGKSTLLKVLSGILIPKKGQVHHTGRITSLIELGAGFDPELSAEDNIYLSCMLMGATKREVEQRIGDIIEFAELKDFTDFPLKNYSSGMAAKLGFACATLIDTNIILVDEVLAVGDEAFQRKCHKKINELKSLGKGIILVSHDMSAIENYCDRIYLLNKGNLIYEGSPPEGIDMYRQSLGISNVH